VLLPVSAGFRLAGLLWLLPIGQLRRNGVLWFRLLPGSRSPVVSGAAGVVVCADTASRLLSGVAGMWFGPNRRCRFGPIGVISAPCRLEGCRLFRNCRKSTQILAVCAQSVGSRRPLRAEVHRLFRNGIGDCAETAEPPVWCVVVGAECQVDQALSTPGEQETPQTRGRRVTGTREELAGLAGWPLGGGAGGARAVNRAEQPTVRGPRSRTPKAPRSGRSAAEVLDGGGRSATRGHHRPNSRRGHIQHAARESAGAGRLRAAEATSIIPAEAAEEPATRGHHSPDSKR